MNNLKYTNIFILLVVVTLASACRKVVDWDLEPAPEKLTIESYISDRVEPWKVQLTRTRNYFDNEEAAPITSAQVVISDDQGNSDTLVSRGKGLYMSVGDRQCQRGLNYTLEVEFDGESYKATELCRDQLPIDTLFYFYQPTKNGFIDVGYYVFELAQEISTPGDFYQWRIFRNDTLLDDFGYVLDSDEFADFSFFNSNIDLENITLEYLPRPFPFEFQLGDQVVLEQWCINKNFYDYLIELTNQYNRAGSPFDSPPANPTGNIAGAYGYFAVYSIERKALQITE